MNKKNETIGNERSLFAIQIQRIAIRGLQVIKMKMSVITRKQYTDAQEGAPAEFFYLSFSAANQAYEPGFKRKSLPVEQGQFQNVFQKKLFPDKDKVPTFIASLSYFTVLRDLAVGTVIDHSCFET
jgi:hypothetical protein